MTMKMNKFLVSAAVCGILATNIGVSASAEYLPSFVTGITTTTVEDITDEITDIPEESIIDITEETTISSEIISETTVPVTELVTDDEIGGGAFYFFKIYKGGKAKAPKKVVSDDDAEDETEFDDPNDAVQQETNDSDD